MTQLTFYTLDVFTETIFGGNQLAVFPDAPELETGVMQAIAREFNISETVFVRPSAMAGALRKLRIFTPGAELPFAGHPTIGTAQLLAELGIAPMNSEDAFEFAFEEGVGLVPVSVRRSNEQWFTWLTAARLPERTAVAQTREELASLIGVEPGDILADEKDAPCIYSAGVPFLFIPVRDTAVLGRATIDLAQWRKTLAGTPAEDIYVFCHMTDGKADVRARMFAPGMGIAEDPATGGAAAAFAGYLWKRSCGGGRWLIAQGVEMGRPSTLHVEAIADGEVLKSVRVGGSAVRVSCGTMQLP